MANAEKIREFLDVNNISYKEEDIETGGRRFYFILWGITYCYFTSCWNDYGLSYVVSTNRNKIVTKSIVDFENTTERIEAILKPIMEIEKENKAKYYIKQNERNKGYTTSAEGTN